MANKVLTAHEALGALLTVAFDVPVEKNPDRHVAPANKVDGRAAYVALEDDELPDVLAVMTGPIYDLKVVPLVTLAFSGGSKEERKVLAYAALDTLRLALEADRSLGGTVDYADIASANAVDAAGSTWMAGGLEVGVGLLLSAPTPAG